LTVFNLQVHAQDQLALINYKRGDYSQSLLLLNKALDACLHRSVGRLPYFLLQSHKALVLSAMGSHEESYAILEDYIPSLQSATTNPMGDLELIEAQKIVSHLLVISFHNLSVQLAHLQRWDEAIEITARVLSLVDSGMHMAQPIRRHFVHAHSASLRFGKANSAPPPPYSVEPGHAGRAGGAKENSNSDGDLFRQDSSLSADGKGRWNRWLALAGKGRAVAPLLIELYVPDVSSLSSLEDVPPRGFQNYSKVLEAAARQFPKLEGMQICPDEVLGTVSRAILHFVDEGSYASSTTAAADRFDQIEKLLDEDLFEFCEQLPWNVQVFGIFAKAAFLYNRLEDYEAASRAAQRALDKAKEQEGAGYHVAVCQLCIGACLLRAGQHDDAFNIGKAAISYCHGLSDEQLQDETVRVQMEDVLVGASHLMALSHIFLGNGKVALKLSKIAKEHIKNTSFFGNKSSIQFMQVSRVYEITMSMTELVQDTHVSTSGRPPKRGSRWVDKISSLVPTKFVPGALHRNLPELYPERSTRVRTSRRATSAISFGPGEEIVHDVINRESHRPQAESPTHTDRPKRRYKWTGRYSAAQNGGDMADMTTIASVSMIAPPSDASASIENPGTAACSALPSRANTGYASTVSNRAKTASTPYGNLLTSGLHPPPDPSMTGHPWVDELVHGKEAIRKHYASDPASKLYFAQVYGRARGQSSVLLDPLVKVVPKKMFVVGDHLRPKVGGPRAPEVKAGGSTDKLPHLLRDWGPDPTRELRRPASPYHGVRRSMGSIPARKTKGMDSDGDLSGDLSLDRSIDRARQTPKLDLNELRVVKHAPYDSAVRRSSLGMFVSREGRKMMLDDLDHYCVHNNVRPVTSLNWPDEVPARTKFSISRHGTAKVSVSRPYHWSHAPEPSPYLHSESYRATPYGTNLAPHFKQAFGTNGAQAFGTRSLQTVAVGQQAIVASAELSRKPETAGAIRSLSAFG